MMGHWHGLAAKHAGARVMLVIDPDLGRARRLAARFPGSRAASDITALYGIGALIAHICSPLAAHSNDAIAAMTAGLSALVEKPLAESARATTELLAVSTRSRVTICPVHQFLFQRGTLAALDAIEEIGPIVMLHSELFTAGASSRDESGRDELITSVLPHPLSLIERFLPGSLATAQWSTVRAGPGELVAISVAAHTTVTITVSTRSRPTSNSVKIVGERGTIHLDLFHGFHTIDGGGVSRARKISAPFRRSARSIAAAAANIAYRAARRETAFPGLRRLVEAFYDSVATKSPPPISSAEILDVAVARDRILAAAAMAQPA